MNEDELANAIIQRANKRAQEFKEQGDSDADVNTYIEAHYNHYGNRGVADLYVDTSGWQGHVYELKSQSAVEEATGANKILRQFNKMRKYFFEGSDHSVPSSEVKFELCFTPTERNAKHLIENAEMYASAVENDITNLREDIRVGSQVCFRLPDPENITPILMFSPRFDFREKIGGDHFETYARTTNEELFERIQPALDESL